jgi:GDPmannose 4,6-dehydratase
MENKAKHQLYVKPTSLLKGIKIAWTNEGIKEIGYDINTGRELVFISDKYFRPAEVDELLGDSTKAKEELGWVPSVKFDDLVKEMVEADCC